MVWTALDDLYGLGGCTSGRCDEFKQNEASPQKLSFHRQVRVVDLKRLFYSQGFGLLWADALRLSSYVKHESKRS